MNWNFKVDKYAVLDKTKPGSTIANRYVVIDDCGEKKCVDKVSWTVCKLEALEDYDISIGALSSGSNFIYANELYVCHGRKMNTSTIFATQLGIGPDNRIVAETAEFSELCRVIPVKVKRAQS